MKTKLYIQLLLPIIVAIFFGACNSGTEDKNTKLEELRGEQAILSKQISELEKEIALANPEATNVKAKEVIVASVKLSPFDHFIQTQGRVAAEDDVNVSSKSMGVVTKVFATEGDQVTTGQVLAQIDNGIILRGIEEVKSQLDLANTVFGRQKNLWDQKIGTEIQFLQAKTNKESLEKRLASLNEQNDMTRIKAPISGFVDAVYAKVGQNLAPGMPAMHVVNMSDLKLKADISEAYSSTIHKNDKAIVMIPELKKEFEARVSFVSKTINPLSRTFSVEVRLPSNSDLRPNMSGVIKVVYYSEKEAIVIPINIVQTINNEKIIYVAEQKGASSFARKRVVTISEVFNNQAQVKSGLAEGEKIITFGYQGLNDGEIIKM